MSKSYDDYANYSELDGYGSGNQEQLLQKYLHGFRDRIFIFLPIFLIVGAALSAYFMREQPLYRSFTSLQVLRQEESRTQFEKVTDDSIRSSDDLNTQLKVFESMGIVRAVANRVRQENLRDEFVAPYREVDQDDEDVSIVGLLARNRSIRPLRNSYVVYVEYIHPRPDVARKIADFFAEEIANSYASVRSDGVSRAIQDLREQQEIQRRKVENLQTQLEDFNAKHESISFDRRLEIEQETLSGLKQQATQKTEVVDRLRTQWEMVQAAKESNTPLTQLGFIRTQPEISQILMAVSSRRLAIGDLSTVYHNPPPQLAKAEEALVSAEAELAIAVSVAIETLQNELTQAEVNLEKTQDRYSKKKEEVIEVQHLKADYDNIFAEFEANKKLYQYFYNRTQETLAQNRDDIRKVRILDPAITPGQPFQPLLKDSIQKGVGGGLAVAALVVGLLVFFDDRLKTSHDVESKIELPILGMLSSLPGKHKNTLDLITATERSPQNSEALNSIIASLRLDPVSKNAKTIMVNSTISNEGKSYVSASLGYAFHRFGEKVLLINCDMRAKEDSMLRGVGEIGLVQYLEGEVHSLKETIYHSKDLGCDLMPAGGVSKRPFAYFGSERFSELLALLADSYDRVIIDTPPSNLFGDALSLVPHCQGVIYVCGYGRARVATAKQMVEKLKGTGCPIFGAVVNGVKSAQAKSYYPDHFREKSDYDYYGKKSAKRV